MRTVVAGLLGVTFALGSAHAEPDSLGDLLGPREVAVGEAMRGGATGATAAGLNPGGLPLNRELVFEGGYGYRASDSASLISLSACDSTTAIPGCFFYEHTGASPDLMSSDGSSSSRRTNVAGLALSRMLVPRILIGVTSKYFSYASSVVDEVAAKGFAVDLGATVRLTEMINLGVSAQNLYASADTPAFPRAVGGGVMGRPIPTLTVSFDARWRLNGDAKAARYGGGAELFLRSGSGQTAFPIRAGVLHDNNAGGITYLSAGLGITSLKWGIDVTGRRAVQGGSDNLLLASMRFWGPRMAAPDLSTSIEPGF